jgi:hypothetical protein
MSLPYFATARRRRSDVVDASFCVSFSWSPEKITFRETRVRRIRRLTAAA